MELKDSSGVDVAPDIFDELLRSATVSFKAFIENSGKKKNCISVLFRAFVGLFIQKNCQ